jgi:hypothetical protein
MGFDNKYNQREIGLLIVESIHGEAEHKSEKYFCLKGDWGGENCFQALWWGAGYVF